MMILPQNLRYSFSLDNTPFPPCKCDKEGSFSSESLKTRVPFIVQKIITTVKNHSSSSSSSATSNPEKVQEAQNVIIKELEQLINEMSDPSATLSLLKEEGDTIGDIKQCNEILTQYNFTDKTWVETPFIIWETYLYRRVGGIFARSKYWSDFDYFFDQKLETFISASQSVSILAKQTLADDIATLKTSTSTNADDSENFAGVLKGSLWGNQNDLSMFPDFDGDDFNQMQEKRQQSEASSAIASKAQSIVDGQDDDDDDNDEKKDTNDKVQTALATKILEDHSPQIWQYLKNNVKNGRIDIVLDNAGYELYMDLLLANWLTTHGYAKVVYFHCKRIPWYVSDVCKPDFYWILNDSPSQYRQQRQNMVAEGGIEALEVLTQKWKTYLENGTWKLEDDLFWTGLLPFHYLPENANQLWTEELTKSDLVIFKGDLNFRKLTHDLSWDPSVPFADAIGPLASKSIFAPPIVSLRTTKADTVVNVDSDIYKALDDSEPGWLTSGSYSTILFSNPRSDN
ncbi:Hairy/enhancer-of-split with YRPW motif protein 2 [Mycoemilia scoparia]|uniref:Sugar phosphate phosphatase n=1 Tax=Mycoemilia scoparia TaxID=417184 RepID=A0A9W8DPR5_9FUNG|nr:Hairy/enhancer-of-split with YRPW motif protein 2 [Mycoemilia scoparia]